MQIQKFTTHLNRILLSVVSLMALAAQQVASAAAGEEPSAGSYRKMDYGPVIAETIVAAWPKENIACKGLAVRLDHEAAMIFDTDLMRWSAATAEGWIDLSKSSHTSYKGRKPPTVEGTEVFATAPAPGWAKGDNFDDPREDGSGPLPEDWARWRGFFRHRDRVILSYSVGGVPVLESPRAVKVGESIVFVREIQVSASREEMTAYVAEIPAGKPVESRGSGIHVKSKTSNLVFQPMSELEGVRLRVGEKNRLELDFPPREAPVVARLLVWEETAAGRPAPRAVAAAVRGGAIDFADAISGGPARWEEEIETAVELSGADAAYVTDRIGLPFDNPWGSWIRPSGIDFFRDGTRAAVSTWNGDVWIVSGLGGERERVRWRRFASGLFYPMGVAIVDEKVHVIERSQLTRLHDLNGNGEADYYENVNNAGLLHPMAHALCLEVDSRGNFYYFKNGNRVPSSVRDHGALIRISADGSEREVFATGIRGANTLGIGPGDRVFGADQQGGWISTSRVDWLRKGGFYGDRRHNPQGRPEGDYDLPVCWIPHRVDNSSGAIAFADGNRWGPMNGNWIMTSYGRSTLFALLVEEKGDQLQGGVVQFPLEFDSGVMRARMNPGDGQLYLLGLKGWQTTGKQDGSFDRVRYTGMPCRMPIGLGVEPGTVRIDFADALDPESARVENFEVERWQYIYSARYGSPEMSVDNPEDQGRDPVAVSSVRLSEDHRSVFLEIPDLKPVMQQSVAYRLCMADGAVAENTVYHTIHRMSGKETETAVVSSAVGATKDAVEDGEAEKGEEEEWAAFDPGRRIFENTCSSCHQPDGRGVALSLSTSAWAGGDPAALARIVLQGKIGEQGIMMPFSWLSDEEIASLLSYIRVRWHDGDPVSTEEVSAIREATKNRSGPWTVEELNRLGE